MKLLSFLSILLLCVSSCSNLPSWVRNQKTSFKEGKLEMTCLGKSLTLVQARALAIAECKKSASDFFNKESSIKSLAIETEQNVALHSEIVQQGKFKNLICNPLQDYSFQEKDLYNYWIKCEFDEKNIEVEQIISNEDKLNSKERLQTADKINGTTGFTQKDSEIQEKTISIASIPPCTDILIEGALPRVISCKGNPTVLLINSTDINIKIRVNNYAPKDLKVSDIYNTGRESFSVILDPM